MVTVKFKQRWHANPRAKESQPQLEKPTSVSLHFIITLAQAGVIHHTITIEIDSLKNLILSLATKFLKESSQFDMKRLLSIAHAIMPAKSQIFYIIRIRILGDKLAIRLS